MQVHVSSLSPAPSCCRQAEPADLQRFGDHIASSFLPNTVIVDATASEGPPAHYMEWLQRGIHIITPNKKLGSGPLDHYRQLRKFQRDSYIRQFQREFNIHFLYEVRFTCIGGLVAFCEQSRCLHALPWAWCISTSTRSLTITSCIG